MKIDRRLSITQRGFTLIELLVVISIILLLIGILLPALRHARATGKAAVCRSNLHQLLVATSAYLNDHKEIYPQPSNSNDDIVPLGATNGDALKGAACWFNALDPYLMQVSKDYAESDATERNYKEFKQDPVYVESAYPEYERTLKMNAYFAGNKAKGEPIWTDNYKIRKTSQIVVYGDGRGSDCQMGGDLYTKGQYGGQFGKFEFTPGTVGLRHDKGANIAFADQHVSQETQEYKVNELAGGKTFLAWYTEAEDAAKPSEDLQLFIWDFHSYQ